jgi:cytochrome c oxidase assembly factor CtaG
MYFSYAGLVVLGLSIVSPLQYWSMQYFWVHMLQHVAVMLAAPALYVGGAPWLALAFSLPVGLRRRVLSGVFLQPRHGVLRRISQLLLSPAFGIIFFNLVMVFWMLPVVFDPVMSHPNLHIGLMLSSFFFSGVLFWIHFIPSYPFTRKLAPMAQAGSLLLTNLVMTIIAIAISFLVSVPSYNFGASMMAMMMGGHAMAMPTINPLVDQQIGAAILWVCGDFWCFPALYVALRRATKDEDSSNLMDKFLRGQRAMSAQEFQEARAKSRPQ